MRLGVISAKYPYGSKEPYLDTELRALAPGTEAIVVIPASPDTAERGFTDVAGEVVRLPLLSRDTMRLAARTLLRRPGRAVRALVIVLFERYPLRAKLKNLAVVPKALAVAELARRHRLDHLHAYWLSTPATVAWFAARVAGIAFSATAHRWDIYEDNLTRRKLADARFVRTISERGRRDLLARTGADPARVTVIRLGVALAEEQAHAGARPDGAPLRILCAAALVPVKGHAVLLEALTRLRRQGVAFACTFAGDGPLRADLAAAAEAAGLGDAVTFAGVIPHDRLLERLQRGEFDVSVLASVERGGGLMEGVPVALIEAMASGTVVVATASGSIGELVDGETGLLVPHSDPAALAEALARVARDGALRARLRAAAQRRVRSEFDVRRTIVHLRERLASA